MFEKKVKICTKCGEKDLISVDKDFCESCAKKEKQKNYDILSI